MKRRPTKVAVVGGGCGSIAAAFELTRPEHKGKYRVTVYQVGWRLGGKGASGRGPAGRIEEHGLHVWLGFYENAFRLLRECYAERKTMQGKRLLPDWQDVFLPDHHVGMADPRRKGGWVNWTAHFPPTDGLPGDPLDGSNPFTLANYLSRAAALLRTLILDVQTCSSGEPQVQDSPTPSAESVIQSMLRLVRLGVIATSAGILEALTLLEVAFRSLPALPPNVLMPVIESTARAVRAILEELIIEDDEARCRWEIIDLVVAIIVGIGRFGLLYDSRGLDAINDYECREWLRLNGASERSLDSAFIRGLYDLALAYEGGDPRRPALAAGQALRGSLRMFFTYRGALFWKMRAGMGDVVFAPFYEVLKKRGVTFRFFHRLENVKVADERPGQRAYIEALQFDIQAKIRGGKEYQPLIDVNGMLCWPSVPSFGQITGGDRMKREGWDFESHWDQRRVGSRTLQVGRDFDFVVLGVSVGAIPYVCRELVEKDGRWRAMVENVKTVATQSFQVWMRCKMAELGWPHPPVTLSAFKKPFDTWADMGQCISAEKWEEPPASLAYFCNILSDPSIVPDRSDKAYPALRHEEVRRSAINFLNNDIQHLWPAAKGPDGKFRWDILVDPCEDSSKKSRVANERRFMSQYWRANVNPSDRYVLALPGTLKHRISPLDITYDNMTIAGDWTDCGFNEGCVEAAFISGRLAAHSISESPTLEEIIGYDHP
jgi:uncharacterized protein with NAD-binding domain and iron-sulfur cluster